MNSREPPKKMRDLLNEYIADQGIEDSLVPLEILDDLKENLENEMQMKNSNGELFNPYR